MKKIINLSFLSLGLLLLPETVTAKRNAMRHMLKLGANVGVSLPQENASFAGGLDLTYQYLFTPGWGIGLTSGYTHFFGKDRKLRMLDIENNDFGVVPLAAMVRHYPKDWGVYFGGDIGYGFIVGDDNVHNKSFTKRPSGGFYIKPEVGYHNDDWNFGIQYAKVVTGDEGQFSYQKYNAGTLSLKASYNIPLNK